MVKPKRRKDELLIEYHERASKLYYNSGYHIKEIAKKLKIDEVEVYNYVVTSGNRITTSEEREEMIQLFNEGHSYSDISRILNRSRACIKDRIESPAKINCKITNKLTDRQLKKMKNMVDDGAYIETIAEELGVSVSCINSRLGHTNMRKSITHVTPYEVKQFIILHKKGKTHKQIAKICNRSVCTVGRHLKAAGYTGRYKEEN